MKKRVAATFSLIAVLTLPRCFAAAGASLSTAQDGSTIAKSASGTMLWQRYKTNSAPATPSATTRQLTPFSLTMPMWDLPVELDSSVTFEGIAGPIFDSSGNAWVVINDPVNLIAVQSNGTTGTWFAPHVIGPSLPADTQTVGLAVDQTGGFYVTYGTAPDVDSGGALMWTRYTPTGGWQAPALIYNSPQYFGETFPSIDSAGRLVVVFNANGISSIASDPTQSSWGAVQTISPASDLPLLPSVAASKSGTRLAMVYLINERGLRYTFFNSTTGKWNPAISVPGSLKATFTSYTAAENAFPIAVDESGNVTVAADMRAGFSIGGEQSGLHPNFTVNGFRYQSGKWTTQQLLTPSASLSSIESFGSIALNANGAVLIAVPTYNPSTRGVNISVFRYTPGSDWDTEIAASYNSSDTSPCKIAWFESTEAVAVYVDYSVSQEPLVAALYSDGAWGSAPAIPDTPDDLTSPTLGGAPSGEVLLAFPLAVDSQADVYATWLMP